MQQQTIDSLKTLKWLLDEGVLTAEEFEAQKRTILNNDEPKRMQPEPINMKPAPVAEHPIDKWTKRPLVMGGHICGYKPAA